MTRLHPGWLVALFAAMLSASVWLPWLTTAANGGGHANAVGGAVGALHLPARFGVGQAIVLLAPVLMVAGAMIGRGLFVRLASVAALGLSLLIAVLIAWYYHLNVTGPIDAGYGLYLGGVSVFGAVPCSLWALGAVTVGGER